MEDTSSRNKAFIFSVILHAIIIGVCMWLTLKPPIPLPTEVMMEVAMADLGSTLEGSGKVTPDHMALPSSELKRTSDYNAQPINQSQDQAKELVSDEASETAIKASDKPVENPKESNAETAKVENKTPQKTVNTKALYPGSTGKTGGNESGGSEGNGEGIGDRGNPDGMPGGKGVLGRGNGTWELAGRSLVKGISIETTKEEGIVVLKIWVDRRGNVFKAEPILSQCTTTSEYLFGLAKKAAMQNQYDSKPEAAPEQVGKMTFKFILK